MCQNVYAHIITWPAYGMGYPIIYEVYMDTHLNQVNGGANKLYIVDNEH